MPSRRPRNDDRSPVTPPELLATKRRVDAGAARLSSPTPAVRAAGAAPQAQAGRSGVKANRKGPTVQCAGVSAQRKHPVFPGTALACRVISERHLTVGRLVGPWASKLEARKPQRDNTTPSNGPAASRPTPFIRTLPEVPKSRRQTKTVVSAVQWQSRGFEPSANHAGQRRSTRRENQYPRIHAGRPDNAKSGCQPPMKRPLIGSDVTESQSVKKGV